MANGFLYRIIRYSIHQFSSVVEGFSEISEEISEEISGLEDSGVEDWEDSGCEEEG